MTISQGLLIGFIKYLNSSLQFLVVSVVFKLEIEIFLAGGAPFSPQATSKSTPQNIDAIETLKALGYPVHLLPQANLVCKKKEIDLTVGG